MNLMDMTAIELGRKIQQREISVVDAVKASLEAIIKKDAELNCFITVDEKGALERAAQVQKLIDQGQLTSLLAGVPIAVKDNICTNGLRTTCGSRMLYNFQPAYSAEAVNNLERAGAVIVGKTNMDEFGMGSTTETSAYGLTRNPWNKNHVPGGSSGGSAAAVAAGECCCALGSDTGGSIRQPSAFCGVTGLKPTYGTVSRYGLTAYASSLDQIGPIAKDISDCAALLEVIASYDAKDSTSIKRKNYNFTSALIGDIRGIKIGIPNNYLTGDTNPEIISAVRSAVKALEERGAVIESFDLDMVKYVDSAYYVIASAEAGSNLARFDGAKYGFRAKEYENLHNMYKKSRSEGFGPEVKRRIMLGAFALSAGYYDEYYIRALKAKALIKEEFGRVFQKYDCIITPVSPTTAPEIGCYTDSRFAMYRGDIYTAAVNLAGLPAVSVPCGMDTQGLPIGLQIIGDCFEEKKIIRAAFTFEAEGHYKRCSMSQT